jgi:hypothetical protein
VSAAKTDSGRLSDPIEKEESSDVKTATSAVLSCPDIAAFNFLGFLAEVTTTELAGNVATPVKTG